MSGKAIKGAAVVPSDASLPWWQRARPSCWRGGSSTGWPRRGLGRCKDAKALPRGGVQWNFPC